MVKCLPLDWTCLLHKFTLLQQKINSLFRVDENSTEQCFPAHLVHSCQQYCAACYTGFRFNNFMGSKTLSGPVFNNPVQVDNYLPSTSSNSLIHSYFLFSTSLLTTTHTGKL